jgi:broad specificity phosphatase PhoE
MTRIYMIRHGRPSAPWGEHAEPDPGLDGTGLRQAEETAQALLALPASHRPVRVISSPLRRCRETAQPFAAAIGVDMEVDTRFGEIPTPATLAPEDRAAWLRNAVRGRWPDIEGDRDYDGWRVAVGEALSALGSNSAVFSHYVAINAAVACATGDARVLSFRPDHASITVFAVDAGRLTLLERGREAATQVL